MKSKKPVIIVIAVMVVLAAGAVLALPRLINPESYRDTLEEKAGEALKGRELSLGPMALDLWPGIGLEVGEVVVSELDKAAQPFLAADRIVVRVAILPLLSRKVEVTSIEIDSPMISLVRLDDKNWNFSDLSSAPEKEKESPKAEKPEEQGPEAKAMQVAIQDIIVNNGVITIEDRTAAKALPVKVNVDRLVLGDILSDKPARVLLDASLAGSEGRLSLEGTVGPLTGGSVAERLEADLVAELDKMDLPGLLALLPPDAMPVAVLEGAASGKVVVKGSAAEPIRAETDLTLQGLSYSNTDRSWRPNEPADVGINAKAMIDLDGGKVTVEPANISLPAGDIEVNATWAGLSGGEGGLTLKATSAALAVEKLLALAPMAGDPLVEAGLRTNGPASLEASFISPPKGTSQAKAVVDLSRASMELPGTFVKPSGKAAKLATEANVTAEAVNLSSTGLALGPMDFRGGGKIKRDEKMSTDIKLESGPADTKEALAMFPALKDYHLDGTVRLALAVSGGLADTKSLVIDLTRCEQKSDAASFMLTGRVRLTSPIKVTFDLDADSIDLDRVMGTEQAGQGGSSAGSGGSKPADSAPADYSGFEVNGKVKADRVLYQGTEIKNLSGSPSMAKGMLTIPDTSLVVYEAPLKGPVKLNLATSELTGDLGIAAEGVPVDKMVKNFTTYPSVVSGDAFGTVALSFTGSDADSLAKTAAGSAKVELKSGALHGVDLVDGLIDQWAKSDAVKKLAHQSLTPALKETISENTPFKELSADVKIENGKLRFDKAVMDVDQGQVVMDGSVGFDRSVDMKGKLVLTKAQSDAVMKEARAWVEKQSGGAVKGEVLDMLLDDGRLVLGFGMTGAWPKPKLVMDSTAYSKAVEKNIKDQAVDKVIEQVVGEEKKKEVEDEVEKAKEDLMKKAEEEGKKLLEGIIPK